jgi:tRNA A37 threonylcarbamoyltransferase TsaD
MWWQLDQKNFLLDILCKNAKDFLLKKKTEKSVVGGGVAELR